jgi:hypothetical protein
MELANLKQMMDASTSDYKPLNNNIAELIGRKSQGPFAQLDNRLKFALYPFPLTALLFGIVFINNSSALQSPSMWVLLIILLIEFISSLFNYGIVKKIQEPAGNTKENLLLKLIRLEKSFSLHFILNACLYIVMFILLEIGMNNQWENNFEGWHSVTFFIRILCYTGFFIFQFFIKKYFYKKQFGQNIIELKNLVQQMQ